VFLYKSGSVEGVDKQKLKAEIIAAVIKDGEPSMRLIAYATQLGFFLEQEAQQHGMLQ
jgi:hypothetical protein